jgi:hypothetical protein
MRVGGKKVIWRFARRTANCLTRTKQLQAWLMLLLSMGVVCSATAADHDQQLTIVLDGASKGRTYDGLGAASAGASSRLLIDYPEPQRSEILDYLFKPGYGAALQHLKVEIGADVNSTDGSEPSHMRTPSDHDATRGYEWWLMTEAHKRNPHILLEVLPWGAPRWVNPGAEAKTVYSAKMANYVVDFIQTAKSVYGLDIGVAGIWNERVYDAAYVKQLYGKLRQEHLATKIICCDEYPGEGKGQWTIADAMLMDPELAKDIDVIGVHYPLVNGKLTTTEAARRTGKPLWSSEDQPNGGSGPFLSRGWAVGGRILAHLYNRNYLEGTFTSTEIWSPITSYYDNLAAPNSGLMYANTPWSGHYQVQGAIWATAHTTQFAEPGWQYLDVSSGNLPEKGSYVALRSPDRKNWSVVLETIDAKSPRKVFFKLQGGLKANVVHIWETSSGRTFEHVADVRPKNGVFAYTFDADALYSLTTTTGQGRGTAQPPVAAEFPLPYADDFESTKEGHTPKYLADQDGAFEVHACKERNGLCLEQVITEEPIPWSPLPDPFTLAGNADWKDYRVSVDVRFVSNTEATVIGRIDSSDVFKDEKARWPSGYELSVKPEGAWELLSTAYKKPVIKLASGTVTLDRAAWHKLELTFQGAQITALLDGKQLTVLKDDTHTHGMFGLGSGWNHVQFDNLRVER